MTQTAISTSVTHTTQYARNIYSPFSQFGNHGGGTTRLRHKTTLPMYGIGLNHSRGVGIIVMGQTNMVV